ncbi:MAG: hypothetical protein ACXVRH_11420 [Thermoleophilaceae bacterium]
MAQTRKRRRRKHRGTQAGNIETPAHRSGKTTRASASSSRSTTRTQRTLKAPTWRSASYKAAAAAAVFAVLSATLFHNKGGIGTIFVTLIFVFFLYLPIAYWTDRAVYKRKQAKLQSGK